MACRCLLYSVCFVYNAFHKDLVVRFVAMGQQTNFRISATFHAFNESKQPCDNAYVNRSGYETTFSLYHQQAHIHISLTS